MSYDFTIEDVLNEVIRLSEEDPDFVYTTQPGRGDSTPCGYTGMYPGTCYGRSCIVGQALQNLGVPKDDLIDLSDCASEVLTDYLNIHAKYHDDADRLIYLNNIQSNQDQGMPWGESVTEVIKTKPKEQQK